MSWEEKTEKVLDICEDTFGVDTDGRFTYFPVNGTSYRCRGIFDDAWISIDPNTNAPVSMRQPNLGVKLSDLKNEIRKGDQVEVKGKRYKIVDFHKDVHGGARIFLHTA